MLQHSLIAEVRLLENSEVCKLWSRLTLSSSLGKLLVRQFWDISQLRASGLVVNCVLQEKIHADIDITCWLGILGIVVQHTGENSSNLIMKSHGTIVMACFGVFIYQQNMRVGWLSLKGSKAQAPSCQIALFSRFWQAFNLDIFQFWSGMIFRSSGGNCEFQQVSLLRSILTLYWVTLAILSNKHKSGNSRKT